MSSPPRQILQRVHQVDEATRLFITWATMGAVWNLSETIRRLEYAREPQREVTRSRDAGLRSLSQV